MDLQVLVTTKQIQMIYSNLNHRRARQNFPKRFSMTVLDAKLYFTNSQLHDAKNKMEIFVEVGLFPAYRYRDAIRFKVRWSQCGLVLNNYVQGFASQKLTMILLILQSDYILLYYLRSLLVQYFPS